MRLKNRKKTEEDEDPYHFCIGTVLHVNCSGNKLGDVRTDQFSLDPGVKWADCHCLPFLDRSFDTAIIGHVPINDRLIERQKWIDELARVARKRVVIVHDGIFQIPGFHFSFYYGKKGTKDKPKMVIMSIYDREETGGASS